MDRVLWQPKSTDTMEFQVFLDEDFADGVRDWEPSESYGGLEGYRETIQEAGERILGNRGQKCYDPFNFEEDSALITGIQIGNNGTNLSMSRDRNRVTYDTHNVDTSYERVILEELFGKWAELTYHVLEKSD